MMGRGTNGVFKKLCLLKKGINVPMFNFWGLSFSPIRYQFIVLMMLMATVLVFGYSLFTYSNAKVEYEEESRNELIVISRALNNDYAKLLLMGLPSTSIEVRHKWKSFPMIKQADLADLQNSSVLRFARDGMSNKSIKISNIDNFVISDDIIQFHSKVIYQGKQVGVVRYVVSNARYQQLIDKLLQRLLISIPFALVLSVLLSVWLQRVFVFPLQRLMQSINTIVEKQDYSAVIDIHPKDNSEFALLGKEFNALLNRVDITLQRVEDSKAYAQELAYYDELTKLPNRRLLNERMEYILDVAKREERYGALLFIDLDHFKTLNDSRGHAAGDELLKMVSERLKKVFRSEDTIARLGGDEFVILSGHLEPSEEAVVNQIHSLMLKLRYVLSANFQVEGESYRLTASVGVTTFPGMAKDTSELLKQADGAMYQAKEAGRDGYRFYESIMQEVADARLQMENDLRQAIEKKQFELYYQPQVDEYGRILGAEALLRWIKNDGHFVSPADFIPVAEQTGLILPVGEWVMEEGFQQLAKWQTLGIDDKFRLSINISPNQFHQDDFVKKTQALLKETNASANHITLEVTEGITISNLDATIVKMETLTELGFKISMDDFGTGYSSLTYLKKLPLAELKVDQSFVRDLHIDKSDAEIAATIIAMAKNLNLEVVAEGVEEESQLRFLSRNGCKIFQGYYFHRPMPVKDIHDLLFGNLVVL
jgi:diguanylate cyclase (GGDEF)-like protein